MKRTQKLAQRVEKNLLYRKNASWKNLKEFGDLRICGETGENALSSSTL